MKIINNYSTSANLFFIAVCLMGWFQLGQLILATVGYLIKTCQAAEYQISDPIPVRFEVTVVNAVDTTRAEDFGCVLNEDETELEC